MASRIRRVEYFYTTVRDQPGEAYKLLHLLAELGINQLAFTAVPTGPMRTQLAVFPEQPSKLISEAERAKLNLMDRILHCWSKVMTNLRIGRHSSPTLRSRSRCVRLQRRCRWPRELRLSHLLKAGGV